MIQDIIKPTWQYKDQILLYHMDSYELLKQIKKEDADILITDGPYGIAHPCNFKKRGRGKLAKCNDYPDVIGDDKPFDPKPLLDLELPSILFGGNHFASRLPDSGGWLVWDKQRPETLDQATCELAWTNCVKGVRIFRHLWNGCMRASERKESYHPTQKPVALMEWILNLKWIKNYQSVLDPFMGSGPIPIACLKTGRKCIGAELSKEYFDITVDRLEKEIQNAAIKS